MKEKIKVFDWRTTYSCDNKCLYCFGFKPNKRMSIEDEEVVINKIISFPCEVVNITGGEPLLDVNRCFNIIKRLTSADKKVYLSTNGTNLSQNIEFIKKHVTLLGLPLDGYDGASTKLNGRLPSSFDNITNALKELKDSLIRPRIKIGTVITKQNCNRDFLLKMYDLISSYSVDIWRIYEMLPVNRGRIYKDILELDEADISELTKITMELQAKNPNFKIELVTRKMRNSAYFMIEPDGNVILPIDDGITSTEITVGNLVTDDILSVYQKWEALINKEATNYESIRLGDVKDK